MVVATHFHPVILECEVNWDLGRIPMSKASVGDGIPTELFQILKDIVEVLHSIYQQNWEIQQYLQEWERSIFIPIPKKGNSKEYSSYHTVGLISHASKLMIKILKLGLNSTWTENFQMYKLDLEEAEEPEIKWQISVGS